MADTSGFRVVAAYAPQGVTTLALGIVSGVFATREGGPRFDTVICTDRPGKLRTDLAAEISVRHGLEALASADLVLVLPGDGFRDGESETLAAALRGAHTRGALVAAHCTGVFPLAASGLLDGREATTHWQFAAELAARYPAVTVQPRPLYIDHGTVATGAGAAAGLDLCLHLVRRHHGAAHANRIARDLVSSPHREGGQAQFIVAPIPDGSGDDERLTAAIEWARSRFDRRISVAEFAARALMSPRTFARRFKDFTGATPHAWLLAQRLARAEQLLERSDLSVEEVARRVGYSSATVFREQFASRRGVPPHAYRKAFAERG